MRVSRHLFPALLATLVSLETRAQPDVDRAIEEQRIQDAMRGRSEAPGLDPKRIINESSSFLKEREPEMSAEEYAIYERVAMMLNQRPEFALKLLEAMMNEKEPPSPAFSFILGNAYYAVRDYARSESAFKSAIDRYPTFLRAWSNLGVMYYTSQRYADAARCFSKCVTLGDRDAMTYGLLGYSLEQEKKIVPAEMAYMQALSGDPDNSDWLEGLLRIYVQGKQYARAEWLLKDLLRQRPGDARFWLTYADVLLAQNRRVEAIAVLELCAGSGVAGTNELEVLAGLYADQRLVPEAIATYQRVAQALPALGQSRLLTYANVLIGAGQLDGAERVLASLDGKVAPERLAAFQLARADLYAARKQWIPALAELRRLLQSEPLNGPALLALGRVHLAENSLEQAQFAFEAAAQIPDSTYRASLELATLELKNRRYDKTVLHLERALSIEKTTPVQDLLARVRPLVDPKR